MGELPDERKPNASRWTVLRCVRCGDVQDAEGWHAVCLPDDDMVPIRHGPVEEIEVVPRVSPPGRMREAVEAGRYVADRLWSNGEEDLDEIVEAIIDAAFPHLSAPPSQLPAEPSPEACRESFDDWWLRSNEVLHSWDESGEVQRVGWRESLRAAYAIDSRPSLDLTEQELGAIHELAACEAGLLAPKDNVEFRLLDGIVGKVSAELGRRQGTSQ